MVLGMAAATSVAVIFFAAVDHESWLPYLAPISYRVLNAVAIGPTMGVGLMLVVGTVLEWTALGLLVDGVRQVFRWRK